MGQGGVRVGWGWGCVGVVNRFGVGSSEVG